MTLFRDSAAQLPADVAWQKARNDDANLAERLRPADLGVSAERGYVGVSDLAEAWVAKVEAKNGLLRELLEEINSHGILRGRFARVHPRPTALAIFGMSTWYRGDGEPLTEEPAAQFSALIHWGLDLQ